MADSATERLRVTGPGYTYVGKQGFTYGAGASAETVGAKAHYHQGVETIAYLLEGECAV